MFRDQRILSTREYSHICSKALGDGQEEWLKTFLQEQESHLDKLVFAKLFDASAQNGNTDFFRFMMEKYFERIPEEYVRVAISKAFKNENEAILDVFLGQYPHKLSEYHVANALSDAICLHRHDYFFKILDQHAHQMLPEHLGKAFAHAVQYKNEKAFTYLFEQYKAVLPEIFIGRAFINAAEYTNNDAFHKILTQMGEKLSDYAIGEAFEKSAAANNLEVFHTVLKQYPARLSNRNFNQALGGFAKNSLSDTQWMLQNFSDRLDVNGIRYAIDKCEDTHTFKLLLQYGGEKITVHHLAEHLLNAVKDNKIAHVDHIFESCHTKLNEQALFMPRMVASVAKNHKIREIFDKGCYTTRIEKECQRLQGLIQQSKHKDLDADQKQQGLLNISQIASFAKESSVAAKDVILSTLSAKEPTELLKQMRQILEMKAAFKMKVEIGEHKKNLPEEMAEKIFKQAYPKICELPYDVAKQLLHIKGFEKHLQQPQKSRELTR